MDTVSRTSSWCYCPGQSHDVAGQSHDVAGQSHDVAGLVNPLVLRPGQRFGVIGQVSLLILRSPGQVLVLLTRSFL